MPVMLPRFDSSSIAKRLLAGVAALILATAAAHAADMPVKAPVFKAAPLPPTWTGAYAGINVGYSFGNDSYRFSAGGPPDPAASLTEPRGAVLGGQVGYNWQLGNVVLGVEGDAQWTKQDATGCAGPLCVVNQVPETDARLVEHRLTWFMTLRGRAGWEQNGWLFYFTGGGAWAGLREYDSVVIDFIPGTVVHDATLFGYAAGLGTEVRVSSHVTAKFEYLHLDFGGLTNFSHNTGSSGPISFDVMTMTTSRVTDNIFRIGINYQFTPSGAGGPFAQAYASAAPASAFDWRGFYLGVNGGYGLGHNQLTQLDQMQVSSFLASYAPATIGPKGALFGGQTGYNWQMGHVVLGFEGDAQWAGMTDTVCDTLCEPISQRLKWFATARGRLGWAMPSWMLYATAGGAWGGIDETDTQFIFNTGNTTQASFSQTRRGWTAGGGLEFRLWERWTGKLEYLHLDLGSTTNVSTVAGPPIETLVTTSQIRSDIVRLGLNYKLWN
jgi:outer membrane immunogenic protein